jgi:hypothetical protein
VSCISTYEGAIVDVPAALDDRKMPLPLIKTYVCAPLTGLDYLHKECRLVHTGKFIVGLASSG